MEDVYQTNSWGSINLKFLLLASLINLFVSSSINANPAFIKKENINHLLPKVGYVFDLLCGPEQMKCNVQLKERGLIVNSEFFINYNNIIEIEEIYLNLKDLKKNSKGSRQYFVKYIGDDYLHENLVFSAPFKRDELHSTNGISFLSTLKFIRMGFYPVKEN